MGTWPLVEGTDCCAVADLSLTDVDAGLDSSSPPPLEGVALLLILEPFLLCALRVAFTNAGDFMLDALEFDRE